MIAMMSVLLSFAISSIHLVLVLYGQRCFVDAEAGIESPALLLVIYMQQRERAMKTIHRPPSFLALQLVPYSFTSPSWPHYHN
jgi:hypothetical protein